MAEHLIKPRVGFGTAPVFLTAISRFSGDPSALRVRRRERGIHWDRRDHSSGTRRHHRDGHGARGDRDQSEGRRRRGVLHHLAFVGLEVGGAIGIALFLSQAISVAFYVIAFGEALTPAIDLLQSDYGIAIPDKRLIMLPATVVLALVVIGKGANLGVRVLYVVAGILGISLVLFFLGGPLEGMDGTYKLGLLSDTVEAPDAFFLVFAICFPGFTGMTAGVGLSGDLSNPRRSIPIGTLAATLMGMLIYVAVAFKLAVSASPADLVSDQLSMSRIALWGPIIPIGLGAATISSALGSSLVAPRTLQAVAGDRLLPWARLNQILAKGKHDTNEPTNASVVVFAIAAVFVAAGSVDFVARIISMVFMVSYGSLCLISFLEHFAADLIVPSFFSVALVHLPHRGTDVRLAHVQNERAVRGAFPGAHVAPLRLDCEEQSGSGWPCTTVHRRDVPAGSTATDFSSTCIARTRRGKRRLAPRHHLHELRIIRATRCTGLAPLDSYRFGSATYIHLIKAHLSRASLDKSRSTLERLVRLSDLSGSTSTRIR